MNAGLAFSPLMPWPLIAVLGGAGLALIGWSWFSGARGYGFRALALGVLALALLNPKSVRQARQAQPDVVLVMTDASQSQQVGDRAAKTQAGLEEVRARLSEFKNLEVRETSFGDTDEGTMLFEALSNALADIPRRRFAGAIVITDGQVHDVPSGSAALALPGPLHVLLSGKRGETDRRLVIEKAPVYGVVGRNVEIAYRIEEYSGTGEPVRVRFKRNGAEEGSALVPVGRGLKFSFKIEHAGPVVIEMEVEVSPEELSSINNRAAVSINGVRDRLKVLLVSGQPHPGERTWRNLLKSDPSVDLIHFTILRPPEKKNYVPLNELSLIAFPVDELFGEKLPQFDLIIFDRYVVRDVLGPSYIQNIGDYLLNGGAILLASGPEFAGPRSLFRTSLGSSMPVQPTGRVIEQAFTPKVSEVGRLHPVTAALVRGDRVTGGWGRWLRQIEARQVSGLTLMTGAEGNPLLVLARAGKGRIAQLMSDHIWLWARGFEGGGPQGKLLRRLAHWLMKEPDLEEESLKARIEGGRLVIERQTMASSVGPVTVLTPSGAELTVELKADPNGPARAGIAANETGLYTIRDGVLAALATLGPLNPPEFSDLRATADIIGPV
ncbi:MAG: hypothetical protein V3R66_07380, partial [Rhodospirillales bacterium]